MFLFIILINLKTTRSQHIYNITHFIKNTATVKITIIYFQSYHHQVKLEMRTACATVLIGSNY